jgi:hypothetical protein
MISTRPAPGEPAIARAVERQPRERRAEQLGGGDPRRCANTSAFDTSPTALAGNWESIT